MVEKVREDIGMWESVFRPPSDEKDLSEAEIKAIEDEKNKIKAEWVKRKKVKKWAEEEDKKMAEDYRVAIDKRVAEEIDTVFEGFDSKEKYIRVVGRIDRAAASS